MIIGNKCNYSGAIIIATGIAMGTVLLAGKTPAMKTVPMAQRFHVPDRYIILMAE